MLIPSTMTALRIRRYTSTWYIRPTIHRLNFQPIDGRGQSSLQPPNVSDYPPAPSTLTPPFTVGAFARYPGSTEPRELAGVNEPIMPT